MSFKNIIVFGANGQIGQHVLGLASKQGLKLTAVVRSSDQGSVLAKIGSGISSKVFSIDEASVGEIRDAIKGHDSVVVTVGSRGKNLLGVDLDGVVKVFEATVAAQVRRLVLVSAAHADDREFFSKTSLNSYYIAKHYADRILINEFGRLLDYTILQPGALADGEGTGKIRFIEPKETGGKIDRADVASVILLVLDKKQTFGKTYEFVGGDKEIDSAF